MKKAGLAIVLSFLLLFILFFIKEKLSQAQNFGIELYVYPKGFYGGGNLIKVENAGPSYIYREEDKYKLPLKSVVVEGSEYQIKLKGVGTGFFNFQLYTLGYGMGTIINCTSVGKISGNDCIIEGTFQSPTKDYEKWTIQIDQNNRSASTSFYLVKQSYAQTSTIASKDDQYYLEPTSTTTEPTSTINYKVYSNKLYCPNYMASGISTTTPSPVSGSFVHFRVASSSFLSVDYVVRNLGLNGISEGVYELYLVNSLNKRIGPSSPVKVTITVKPPFTPPPGSFECPGAVGNWCRCVFSYCYWWDGTQWVPTSSSACGDVCAGGVRE